MKKIKKFLLSVLGLLLIFISYLFFNLFNFESKQLSVEEIAKVEVNDISVRHLSEAIQIKTISTDNPEDQQTTEFDKFNSFLETTYPLTDSLLQKKIINKYSHLYTWKGSNTTLKPIVLMGHVDVVPVLNKNEWKEDAFKGIIKDEIIWGRGTLDDKINIIGLLETVEVLLKENYTPKRTIYIAFGHDEEIGGNNGALAIADFLKSQNVMAEFVLDEGSVIAQGLVPGIKKDVALIGIAEKGSVSLELNIEIEGGHSSMPGKETAIDVLSSAVSKLKSNPFSKKLSEPLNGFIDFVGPEMPFPNNLIFANSFIFESVITGIYEKKNSGNAMVRTTTSPTIFNAGTKENVIPKDASATLNFRILPGETVESVVNYVKSTINDPRISIKTLGFKSDPSKISSIDSFGFKTIQKTINEIYGDVIVSPTLVVAATDSKHFKNITSDIYRFSPIRINKDNIKSLHGINEKIPVEEFKDAIRFYRQIIINGSNP